MAWGSAVGGAPHRQSAPGGSGGDRGVELSRGEGHGPGETGNEPGRGRLEDHDREIPQLEPIGGLGKTPQVCPLEGLVRWMRRIDERGRGGERHPRQGLGRRPGGVGRFWGRDEEADLGGGEHVARVGREPADMTDENEAAGIPGSGVVGVNGACARLSGIGHKLIVMSFCMLTDAEFAAHRPKVVIVAAHNRVGQVLAYPGE